MKFITVDTETTPEGNTILIGSFDGIKYRPFENGKEFYKYLKNEKIRKVWCHNLEFDFFKIYETFPDIKFNAFYTSGGLCYIQNGLIYWKDTLNYLPFKLKDLALLVGMKKMKIDYNKIKKITPYLLKYNKNDCEITYKIVKEIQELCEYHEIKSMPSTSGSLAFRIFQKKYNGLTFQKIPDKVLKEWRWGYAGGFVEAFKTGKFENKNFYKIDVNSIFPYQMLNEYPYPYDYKKVYNISNYKNIKFVIGIDKENKIAYNSVEYDLRKLNCSHYYIFPVECYPFKNYVTDLYKLRKESKGIKECIYKRELTGLYGKFGQKNVIDMISTNPKIHENVFYEEEIADNLYRIKRVVKNKFWVNVVWSSFTTSRARKYIKDMIRYINNRGLTVYYVDTDGLIVSGDLSRIDKIINQKKIGYFKIEDMSNSIEIQGKKLYRFGNEYKVKGVPEKYKKIFFEDGYVQYKKMVRLKESFRRNLTFGSWIGTDKRNIKNLPLTK